MALTRYVYIQSHLDSAMLHLDVASRQIDLLQKVRIHASMIYTFFVNLHGSEYRQYIALMVR